MPVADTGSPTLGATHVVFEHSGHFMWLEEPDAFFPLVASWLSSHVTG